MRYSTGYLRKQRGKWIGAWSVNGRRVSESIGLVKDLAKGDAKEKLAELIKESRQGGEVTLFGPFVEGPYFSFYSRKWKHSTRGKNIIRVRAHLVREFRDVNLSSLKRDGLQDFLDSKARFSYSLVNKPRKKRSGLIAKLCVLAGLRPGEVFALRWGSIAETFVKVRERVYEGVLDSPKSARGTREGALGEGLIADIAAWKTVAVDTGESAFVFRSERGTPLSSHNIWQRNMEPKLKAVGLEWCTFQVMRRPFVSLCKATGGDPKAIADQCGHDIGVSVNVYTQSTLDSKLELVNRLERSLLE